MILQTGPADSGSPGSAGPAFCFATVWLNRGSLVLVGFLFCLCQHRLGTLNYSPWGLSIIAQTVPFPAQISVPFSAPVPLDHMFAHRQRKSTRRGTFLSAGRFACTSACHSAPSLSCLEGGHRSLFRLFLLLRDHCLGDAPVDFHRRLLSHLISDMGVGVQRGRAGHMAQDGGQRLDVHPVGQGVGCKSMPQIVEPNPIASRMV